MTTFLMHGSLRSDPTSLVGVILDGVGPQQVKAATLFPYVIWDWHRSHIIRPQPGDQRGVLLTERQMHERVLRINDRKYRQGIYKRARERARDNATRKETDK
jgi:hypothetical protein